MNSHEFYAASMQGLPTTYIQLDKRYKNSEGKYHAKLWVTFRVVKEAKRAWDQQPYVTGFFMIEDDFIKMMDQEKKTKRPDLIDIRKKLQAIQARADHLIEKYAIRDQKIFDLFFLSENNIETVAGQFELKVKKCMDHKPKAQVSSAEKFNTALKSLHEFSHPNLTFQEITPEFLAEYQDWYTRPVEVKIKRGKNKGQTYIKCKSLTSVGINLRHTRIVFNQAIGLKVIPPDCYPFGQDRYIIPEGGEEERELLSDAERMQFLNYQPTSEEDQFFYDFAIFIYFGNGVNPADISGLKFDKLSSEYITILRQKTEGKQKKVKKITVVLHHRMRAVLNRHKVLKVPYNPDDYVFPILDKSMDAVALFKENRKFVRGINDILANMASHYNWSVKPTCYTLRHLFSQVVLEMGATTEQLQDMLGHGTAKTTEAYKKGFQLEVKKKFSEGLG